ncbi:Nuclear distribution protein PAC1 {ECO:0000255/HAMAP-Rule:MF_03141} AltName: Full=Lissencephaly-1 homolog {ECO:0000255/HAMAP-Rule:MF_03141}; Short=LIS-1 {ECO:0000255/HAMAP-Rule:MF_03141}; AltName: Full=nudF homolog {ECO:0000255/HAMAP-Rule:MF_03141} [Serendipita indica DSM 11827]|nr:Nuclear distribution protein PAC1 {ECO:0000255/HAMAP-Rule:MF_03141} AltName: Full=Lissencephaly-1 homolog {ECO:0000255/HAMAP-Rule:MF_03141}; Short=LIS-1 {ECO:0000255/HAMAP-Rule:MF_03141}; AltName: Full=nudF homolog {ECO:0000255/HAMAP-Rule:MF_03141} [Serendipita indica DSM 11827]
MSSAKPNKFKISHTRSNLPMASSSAPSSSSKRNQVRDAAKVGLEIVANISEGSDVLAPLKAACRTTKSILDVVQSIESNQEGWNDLKRRIRKYISVLEDQVTVFEKYPPADRAIDEAFSQPLVHYIEFLETTHDALIDRARGSLKRISKVKIDAEEIINLNRDVEDRHSQFMGALNIFNALCVQVIRRKVDAAIILQLPEVKFSASSVHSTCLKETREAVLQTIWHWANDNISEKPIFWLCDIAGSGKSTVAMSAVESWSRQGLLGGRFFFSISSSEGSTTEKFCSTVARDLAHYIPELAPHIAGAVNQYPSFMRSSLEEQFQTLITHPVRHWQGHVILVIDALDECKSASQRRELADTLSIAVQECKNLKIFMTSRPDPIIQAALGSRSIKAKLEDRLHDVKHRDNIDDVAIYVHRSLGGVLPEDKRQRLVEKANGLFIWASTACRILNDKTSLSSPESMYNRLISVDHGGAIDDLYSLIFERTNPEYREVMYQMLALLLAAFEPLTVDDLDDILKHIGIEGSAKALLQNLGSVLIEDTSTKLIQFRHPTFVEYLRRCSITPTVDSPHRVLVNLANAHGQVASWCFKCFKSPTEGLKFNVCQIESSFYLNREIPNLEAKISDFISRRLRYAGSHWLFHIAETDGNWQSDLKDLLQNAIQVPYALYWMEILSLIGGVRRAIASLQVVTALTGLEEGIKGRIDELRRFLIAFSVPIQDSVPHIYLSALPFSPRKSQIHIEGVKKYPNTLTVTQGLEDMYPGITRTLRGHQSRVNAVAFSPDSARVISGSHDKTIRVWDVATGQPLGEPLRGHEDSVLAVAFSPDGSLIASCSKDLTIRLWNSATCQSLGEPLRGHKSWVLTVSFSPDGSKIVSGSHDKTIRLWDAATGQPLREPFQGHRDSVSAIGFSPDGSQIISGSWDETIRLWDASTGQPLGEPLRGHEDLVLAVAFSPEGSRILSGSNDKTIKVWDAASGQPLGEPLRGHDNSVKAIAFSLDGSRFVSGSYDTTIRLWDATTGQPLGEPLRGHKSSVNAVAFSPDGSQIVSGSDDKTIRLWDAVTGQPMGRSFGGYEASVTAVSSLPGGSGMFSRFFSNTMQLWDLFARNPLAEPFRGHKDLIWAVAFSPDGSRIISGSEDKTIQVWDAATGKTLGKPLRGHDDSVKAIAFSLDGSRIVSCSKDLTIRHWDVVSGQLLGEPLRGPALPVWAAGFSLDGSRIVSGSGDHTLRLWDAATGQQLGAPLRGHKSSVRTVAFSADGSRIVSGSDDKTIRLWDAVTGQPLGEPLQGHESEVYAVAFSPDGSQIVSGSTDRTIRLWDAATGEPLGQPFWGHNGWVSAVAFSPDGSRIVSGSNDKTICQWLVNTDANKLDQGRGSTPPDVEGDSQGTRLEDLVPGFKHCTLLKDGWVRSSGKHLFWVPPDNREGLQNPRLLLTMPRRNQDPATQLDFTHFQYGHSWINAQNDPGR